MCRGKFPRRSRSASTEQYLTAYDRPTLHISRWRPVNLAREVQNVVLLWHMKDSLNLPDFLFIYLSLLMWQFTVCLMWGGQEGVIQSDRGHMWKETTVEHVWAETDDVFKVFTPAHTHWIRWSFSVQSLCSFLMWIWRLYFYWNDPQEAKRNGCARFKLMKWNLVPLMGSSGLRGSLNAARDSAGFPWCCHGERLILEWQNCQHS